MKNILMLATGGTIASKDNGNGLSPAITSEQILSYVPDIKKICHVKTVQLMNLDSTNITPSHWLKIAAVIQEKYENFDGFVITHGTDTMAYTAAAISYLIQRSPKPIVITGSQKPICQINTDGRENLYNSFLYASDSNSNGVSLVFDDKVILGSRARKERTKSRNAFSSVDYPEIAVIRDHRLIRYLTPVSCEAGPVFYNKLDDRVLLLPLIPGFRDQILSQVVDNYRGLILQSFGVGGIPGSDTGRLANAMEKWFQSGKIIVIMTQVPYEGSDMSVYEVGRRVKKKYGFIETYNMTTEAAVTKLMWAMGQVDTMREIQKLFCRPVQFDIIH